MMSVVQFLGGVVFMFVALKLIMLGLTTDYQLEDHPTEEIQRWLFAASLISFTVSFALLMSAHG